MWREQPRRNRRKIARIHSKSRGIDDQVNIGKLRAQCRFVPWHCFEARDGAKHARSGKKRLQPLDEGVCFLQSAIDKDQTFTILERALPGNGMTRSATGA